jgi:hypothetical protein
VEEQGEGKFGLCSPPEGHGEMGAVGDGNLSSRSDVLNVLNVLNNPSMSSNAHDKYRGAVVEVRQNHSVFVRIAVHAFIRRTCNFRQPLPCPPTNRSRERSRWPTNEIFHTFRAYLSLFLSP